MVPHVAATIVPFKLDDLKQVQRAEKATKSSSKGKMQDLGNTEEKKSLETDLLPADQRLAERAVGSVSIDEAQWRQRTKIAGRIKSVRVQTGTAASNLECTISDGSGSILLIFQGRPKIPGVQPGARLVVEGMVGAWHRKLAILNPEYEIVASETDE